MLAQAPNFSGNQAQPVSTNQLQPSTATVPMSATPTVGPISTLSAPSVNPYATSTASVPLGSTSYGAAPNPTSSSNGINWTTGDYSIIGDFQDTYGKGTGTAITDLLKNMGTTNDSAIQATINSIMSAANRGYGNIQAQQAASGISADSSTAALAGGDYWSQVNTGLQSTIANMENQQQNTLLQTLLGEGQEHGGDSSWLDTFNSVLNAGAGIAGSFFGF